MTNSAKIHFFPQTKNDANIRISYLESQGLCGVNGVSFSKLSGIIRQEEGFIKRDIRGEVIFSVLSL